MTLYHTTDAIMRDGFSCPCSPVDVSDGAEGDQVLEVVLPDDVDLDEWSIVEKSRLVWEWCIAGSGP